MPHFSSRCSFEKSDESQVLVGPPDLKGQKCLHQTPGAKSFKADDNSEILRPCTLNAEILENPEEPGNL